MGKRILFSPVGGTDPIKYCSDGSMLHICRHYQPDEVVLYLSKEMTEKHREDNRYVKCIELLGELLHHNFLVRVIENPEFVLAISRDSMKHTAVQYRFSTLKNLLNQYLL